MSPHRKNWITALTFRWIARTAGLVFSAYFVYYMITSGLTGIMDGSVRMLLPFILMLIMSITGYLLSWAHATLGGIIQIAGGVSMASYLIVNGGEAMHGKAMLFGIPYIVCGFFFFISRYHHITARRKWRRHQEKTSTTGESSEKNDSEPAENPPEKS